LIRRQFFSSDWLSLDCPLKKSSTIIRKFQTFPSTDLQNSRKTIKQLQLPNKFKNCFKNCSTKYLSFLNKNWNFFYWKLCQKHSWILLFFALVNWTIERFFHIWEKSIKLCLSCGEKVLQDFWTVGFCVGDLRARPPNHNLQHQRSLKHANFPTNCIIKISNPKKE
jgi:hypothetical protein